MNRERDKDGQVAEREGESTISLSYTMPHHLRLTRILSALV